MTEKICLGKGRMEKSGKLKLNFEFRVMVQICIYKK